MVELFDRHGVSFVAVTQQFNTGYGYSGASLCFHLASIIAGGPAPLIATALLADLPIAWAAQKQLLGLG